MISISLTGVLRIGKFESIFINQKQREFSFNSIEIFNLHAWICVGETSFSLLGNKKI